MLRHGKPLLLACLLLFGPVALSAELPWSPLTGDVGDGFGVSAASIGDVSGDGIPDLVVGAWLAEPSGTARVIDGATGNLLFAVPGDVRNFGVFVAPAGDFDGDEVPDFLASSIGWQGKAGAGEPGYLGVYSGTDGGEIVRAKSVNILGFFGRSAAVVDDLDGDGIHDLLIGEPGLSGRFPGVVAVYSGADGSVLPDHVHPGTFPTENFGQAVAALGDVDGDGVGDYAAGSRLRDPRGGGEFPGQVLVWSGKTGEVILTIDGKGRSDLLGESLANLGDLDGDGVDDLAVGARGREEIHVVSLGKSKKKTKTLLTIPNAGDLEDFPSILAPAGDVDGDGRADLIATARDRVLVLSSATGAPLFDYAGEEGSGVGTSAASAGDLNGDGVPDLLAADYSEALHVLTYEPRSPLFFPVALKLGATLVRTKDAADSKAKGKLSVKAKKSKVTFKLSVSNLPGSGEHTLLLETGTRSDVFEEVAAIDVAGGKGKLVMKGVAELPPELNRPGLNLRTLGDLEGRRFRIEDGSGVPVLETLAPPLDQPKSTKTKLTFTPEEGSPLAASAVLKLSDKAATGASKFDLKIKGIPKGDTAKLYVQPARGEDHYDEAGEIVDGRLTRSRVKGEHLPIHLPLADAIERLEMLVTWQDTVIARYEPPEDPGPLPDFRVAEVHLSYLSGNLLIQADVKNRGAADAGPVDLTARLEYVGSPVGPAVFRTRTSVSFPAGHREEYIAFPLHGALEEIELGHIYRVRVEVDPVGHPTETGEYEEERESNNVRCGVFVYESDIQRPIPEMRRRCTTQADCLYRLTSGPAPDFEVTALDVDTADPTLLHVTRRVANCGTATHFAALVRTEGQITFPSTGSPSVDFGLSDLLSYGIGDSYELGVDVAVPAGALGDEFRVWVWEDSLEGFAEEHEDNNVRCSTFRLIEGEWVETRSTLMAVGSVCR